MELPGPMRMLLERGSVILTANARAARALQHRYAEAQQLASRAVWASPHIFDVQTWLAEQWRALLLTGAEDRLLLNETQERSVWQRLVAPRLTRLSLIAPAQMAALAQQGYALLADHRALGQLAKTVWGGDALSEIELFRQWARSFRELCARQRWLPASELLDAIADAVRQGILMPPAEIGWLGFDRTTAALDGLRTALRERGCPQRDLSWEISSEVAATPPHLYTASSEHDEVTACARWVRAQLDTRPRARIAVLMPELASMRPSLERELFRVLAPQQFPITAGASPALPFEFALGQPLAQAPLIHAALLLLRWVEQPLAQQEVSWLLLSSTLGAAQDAGARETLAQWDAHRRNQPAASPEVSMDALLDALLRHSSAWSGALAAVRSDLLTMLQLHRRSARAATASEWVRRIASLLAAARWGELADASSETYQTREAWDALLDIIASLDFDNRRMSYADLLIALERGAQERIFSPESEGAPVQVMGAYASSGQCFDAVWFLGATGEEWPPAGRPHPLLPIAMQREHEMPHASAALDHALAQRATERILQSVQGEIVFSYAAQTNEALQKPSALVASFAPVTFADASAGASSAGTASLPLDSFPLDSVPDDTWVPIALTSAAPGGQSTLKRQSDCPFQAFAFQRLRVRELPIAGLGLTPLERGKLLHEVLQCVWSQDIADHPHLAGSDDLRNAAADGSLRALVQAHAASAFRRLDAPRREPWQRAYLVAEEARLIDLVMEWLTYERSRVAFCVESTEKEEVVQIGELTLKVRADRIDSVPGGRVLIDYKSGKVTPSSWDGMRPEQPQLPLYATFVGVPDLVGALFAQVRRDELGWKGRVADARANLDAALADSSALVKDPLLPQMLGEWQDALLALAASFVRGEAQVDPREFPKTCEYCPLPGLCRITESQTAALHDESER